jgi:hypothetical protein
MSLVKLNIPPQSLDGEEGRETALRQIVAVSGIRPGGRVRHGPDLA